MLHVIDFQRLPTLMSIRADPWTAIMISKLLLLCEDSWMPACHELVIKKKKSVNSLTEAQWRPRLLSAKAIGLSHAIIISFGSSGLVYRRFSLRHLHHSPCCFQTPNPAHVLLLFFKLFRTFLSTV